MKGSGIYTKVSEIKDALGLTEQDAQRMEEVIRKYPMSVTDYYLSLIDPSDPKDPIRKMCIPSLEESSESGVFDTSGEADNTVALGLQHKYPATALILSTNQCAMYCRHCFRKRMVGVTEEEVSKNFLFTVDYIGKHKEISNVLISGGDSLMMSDHMIEQYLQAFTQMEHLDLIRFGSRIPVVWPDRVIRDQHLQDIFKQYADKKQIYLVTQFNHPRELTDKAKECLSIFRKMGIILRNQTVLLKGVNDDPQVLGTLLKELTAAGILPYYVFQCRPVKGVKDQFQVPLERGAEIVEGAKRMQNGQGKGFRYCMSLPRGKVEILGKISPDEMLFKFHQAKNPADNGRIFTEKLEKGQCWLELGED